MKKILTVIFCILIIIFLKLLLTYTINEISIRNYKNKDYGNTGFEFLLLLNFYQPYVAHYNYGNVLYKNKEYDEAIYQYKEALKYDIPEPKDCKVRINLALAMLKKINKLNLVDDKKEILKILDEAEEVLIENGCAHKNDDNGHSEKAEKLQADIEKMRKKLQNNDYENLEKESDEEDETEEDDYDDEDAEEKEQQLRDIQSESTKERQSEEYQRDMLENFTFYNGKRW